MGIPITDLRQDRHYYYLRLGYAPHFYAILAEFERAVRPEERRYDARLRMWRVAKSAAHLLPQFFPNFETLAAGPIRPPRPIYTRVPWMKLAPLAPYAAALLVLAVLWRTVTPATVARAAQEKLPAPVSRLVSNVPKQLSVASLLPSSASGRPLIQVRHPGSEPVGAALLRARATARDDFSLTPKATATQAAQAPAPAPAAAVQPSAVEGSLPAACRGEGTPIGMVYVNAPVANLREGPSNDTQALGTSLRGEAVCVYKIEGEWQAGTLQNSKGLVWVHQSVPSVTPP